jgi:hypothetical protein
MLGWLEAKALTTEGTEAHSKDLAKDLDGSYRSEQNLYSQRSLRTAAESAEKKPALDAYSLCP